MKFQNHYNSNEFPDRHEKPYGVSMTVPDMTMSIQEIMDRFARGLPIGSGAVPLFEEEEEDFFPDVMTMDPAEREAFLEGAQAELDDLKIRHEARLKKQKEAQDKAKNALRDKAKQKKVDQGPDVQRTSGDAVDVDSDPDPDPA